MARSRGSPGCPRSPLLATLVGTGAQSASALQPNPLGIGLKPVLGWSSWSALRRTPTADQFKAEADAMVSSGLKAAGYEYVNLDDFYYPCPSRAGSGRRPVGPLGHRHRRRSRPRAARTASRFSPTTCTARA